MATRRSSFIEDPTDTNKWITDCARIKDDTEEAHEPYRRWQLYKWKNRVEIGGCVHRSFRPLEPLYKKSEHTRTLMCGALKSGCVAAVLPGTSITAFPEIYIFSLSGKIYSRIEINTQAQIVGIGWNEGENLVCVREDGVITIYSILGVVIESFPPEHFEVDIGLRLVSCVVYLRGISALRSDGKLLVIQNSNGEDTKHASKLHSSKIFDIDLHDRRITCMAVLNFPDQSLGASETFLATADKTVLAVDHITGHVKDLNLSKRLSDIGMITEMVLSSSGKFVACYHNNGYLSVFLSNDFTTLQPKFEKDVGRFETDVGRAVQPIQMLWSGEDSILLAWEDCIRIYHEHATPLEQKVSEFPMYIIAESNVCRIVTEMSCLILEKVPAAVQKVELWKKFLKEGYPDKYPGYRLNKACIAFETICKHKDCFERATYGESDDIPQYCPQHYHRDMVNLDSIYIEGLCFKMKKDALGTAIKECLEAASIEYNSEAQKKFLKAAIYGISRGELLINAALKQKESGFSSLDCYAEVDFDALRQEVEHVCCRLSVLNKLRKQEVGLPLTLEQLDSSTSSDIHTRLASRKDHLTSLAICPHLEKYFLMQSKKSSGALIEERICQPAVGGGVVGSGAKGYLGQGSRSRSVHVLDPVLLPVELRLIMRMKVAHEEDIVVNWGFDNPSESVVDNMYDILINPRRALENEAKLISTKGHRYIPPRELKKKLFLKLAERVLNPSEAGVHSVSKEDRQSVAEVLLRYPITCGDTQNCHIHLSFFMGDFEHTLKVTQDASIWSRTELQLQLLCECSPEKRSQLVNKFKSEGVIGEAAALLQCVYRKSPKTVQDILVKRHGQILDDPLEAATHAIILGYANGIPNSKQSGIDQGLDILKGKGKEFNFHREIIDSQRRLLEQQKDFEVQYPSVTFIDLSLHETIHNLIFLAATVPERKRELFQDVENLQKLFAIPLNRFWHVKINALVKSEQWEELLKMSRKCPLGYLPIAKACIKKRLSPKKVFFCTIL